MTCVARTVRLLGAWFGAFFDTGPVVVQHDPSGRFLGPWSSWTDDPDAAVVFEGAGDARDWLDRHACELGAFRLVQAHDVLAA